MSALSLLILGLLSAVPPASCQQGLGNLQPLDAGPDRHGRVPGPRCNRLCCQPLLVPRRAGAREHGHDRWQQGRWDSGRNGREVLFDGGQLQVQ